jgi:hypothetical protein
MEKKSVDESKVETTNENGKSALINDRISEHEQTVLQVLRGHPVLIWWAFFFSVSAIGWYDVSTQALLFSLNADNASL